MNIYVMRHGTTIWNEKGITQGRTNNRLSKNGIQLTKKQSVKFANKKIDAIICSPLMRTIQTANIMNKFHNVKILKDIDLIEIDQGVFSGKHKNSLSQEEFEAKKSRDKKYGMESYSECFDRIKNFTNNLKSKYNFKNILIVTHNVNATFLEHILKNNIHNFDKNLSLRDFQNAEIKSFKLK